MWDEGWEDEDDEENVPVSAFDDQSRLRILTEKCSTCIFRPGNLMRLNRGRVQDMVQSSLQGGGYITCHQTLPYGDNPEFGGAVCRGFFDGFGEQSNIIRITERLGGLVEVPPPAKEDSSA